MWKTLSSARRRHDRAGRRRHRWGDRILGEGMVDGAERNSQDLASLTPHSKYDLQSEVKMWVYKQ